MFIGHYGVAFGAKALAPKTSLGTLFVATVFIDLLWSFLVLLGIEQVRIVPGITRMVPLDLVHVPWSHSLATVLLWGAAFAAVYSWRTGRRRDALVLGVLVVSHWILDFITHRPDLPLFPGSDLLLGLGLWNSVPGTMVLEGAIFGAGLLVYLRATRPLDGIGRFVPLLFGALLVTLYLLGIFGAPPPSGTAAAWVSLSTWLFILCGWWMDRHRQPLFENRP